MDSAYRLKLMGGRVLGFQQAGLLESRSVSAWENLTLILGPTRSFEPPRHVRPRGFAGWRCGRRTWWSTGSLGRAPDVGRFAAERRGRCTPEVGEVGKERTSLAAVEGSPEEKGQPKLERQDSAVGSDSGEDAGAASVLIVKLRVAIPSGARDGKWASGQEGPSSIGGSPHVFLWSGPGKEPFPSEW